MLRIEKKKILEVTPFFHIYTIFMSFAFMYTFTLEFQAEQLYRGLEIFRWLFIVGFILMFLNVNIKDMTVVKGTTIGWILLWTFVGIMGIAMVNIFGSMLARMSGALPMSSTFINYGVFDDLGIALLAGYNEEIAFTALYFAIDRLVPDHMRVGIPKTPFNISLSHLVTLWATAMLFPIYHIVAYSIWGVVFIVLFVGRIVLQEVIIQSRFIEPAILAHATWDVITVLPSLLFGG